MVYGVIDYTGQMVTLDEAYYLYKDALRKRLPWDNTKTVVSVDENGKLWCNSPTDWIQMVLDHIALGQWRGWQTGYDDTWFAGKRWYNGPPASDWTFLNKYWKRPTGGHYTCLTMSRHYDPMGGKLSLTPHPGYHAFAIRSA